MSTMWAAPGREQVFDAVTRAVPLQPVQPLGVQPTLYPPVGLPPIPTPFFGVPPTPYPFFGVPPTPYAPLGYQPIASMYGVHPLAQAAPGIPQINPMLGIQPTAIPTIGPLVSPVSPLAHPLTQAMLNIPPLTPTFGVQPTPVPVAGALAAPLLTHPLAQAMQSIQPMISTFGIQPTPIPGFVPLGGMLGLQEPFQAAMMGAMPSAFPGLIPSAAAFQAPWLQAALAQTLGMQHMHLPGLAHHTIAAAPVAFILSQLSLKEAASRMPDDAMKERIIANINESTNRYIDDLAGVTLHPLLKAAGPGAVPWVYPIVSELALTAHHFPEGTVRNEILNVASQVLQKSMAPVTGEGGVEGARRR